MQNIGAILRAGMAKFTRGKKSLIGDDHLFKFLIAELTMLIWAIKLDKYKGKPLPTSKEIRAKWITKMNKQLKTNRASSH